MTDYLILSTQVIWNKKEKGYTKEMCGFQTDSYHFLPKRINVNIISKFNKLLFFIN